MQAIQIGDKLHASCSDCFYGTIVGLHKDGNNIDCIDIQVSEECIQDLINCETGHPPDNSTQWPDAHGLEVLELPPGVLPILRNIQYKLSDRGADYDFWRGEWRSVGTFITCNTPGNGCYRCTKLFSVMRKGA